MVKIDNNYLKEYLLLDREIKEKHKKYNQMKEEITKELKDRKGKAIVTRFFIAMFQLMKRTSYNVPTDIKNKYQQETEYNLLKVTERRPDLTIDNEEELESRNKDQDDKKETKPKNENKPKKEKDTITPRM